MKKNNKKSECGLPTIHHKTHHHINSLSWFISESPYMNKLIKNRVDVFKGDATRYPILWKYTNGCGISYPSYFLPHTSQEISFLFITFIHDLLIWYYIYEFRHQSLNMIVQVPGTCTSTSNSRQRRWWCKTLLPGTSTVDELR